MKRTFIKVFACLLCVLAASVALAQSESQPESVRDFHVAMGVASFETGDFETAYAHLERARQVAARDPVVLLLHAQSAIELGRYERALDSLTTILADAPTDPDALFYVGYTHYRRGQYREAAVAFGSAQSAGCRFETLPYYQGASLYRLGDFERARFFLDVAVESSPRSAPSSLFYLGAVEYELGRYDDAADHLEAVAKSTPNTPLGRAATDLAREARRRARNEKWYDARVSAGGAYDTNVIYESDVDVSPNREGAFVFGDLGATVYPYRSPAGHVGFGGEYYQSVHANRDDARLREFDLTRLAARADLMSRLLSGSPALYGNLTYTFSNATLGGETFQNTHEADVGATLAETPATATRVRVTTQWKAFPDFTGRDATWLSPAVAQLVYFAENRGRASVEAAYEHNEADSDSYDYRGGGGAVALVTPIFAKLEGLADAQVRYLTYVFHPDERIDRRFTADVGLRWWLGDVFSVTAGYRHARNVSSRDYSWEKNVTSLFVSATF
ncbi:MAG: tetratricopeptide repeat protein [Deltaproteobacteria bacterium]|nr:tetratricopeptide repeat protein [Deltaproteobacteria bacterium]